MPELPEVETIRRNLAAVLPGKTLHTLDTFTPEVLVNPDKLDPLQQSVQSLERKGKYLLINLETSLLLIHLRMTGKLLFLEGPDSTPLPEARSAHLRARLSFTDQSILLFHDIRRFGRISIYPQGEAWRDKGFASLGPDAISEEWTFQEFQKKLARRGKSTIKGVLLDQKVVAGIGNIYADEALFRATIKPSALVAKLSHEQLKELHTVTKELLLEAIGLGGTSFRDYVNSFGNKGIFQTALAVYQREGQACPRCGATLEKVQVAGRGTRFCPSCQQE